MRIATRIWIIVAGVLVLSSLAIKFYFLPAAERFARLSLEEQIHREMQAFEKIISVVVTAARGDKEYVRRALYAISADKTIPIELRRSDFLNRQFGERRDREPRNDFERQALRTAKAAFRETETHIEYAYPLKAQTVCQTCHTGIPLGSPVGLAIRRIPLTALSDSRISFFTVDLFWENFGLLTLAVLIVLLPVWLWVLRPLNRLSEQSRKILEQQEQAEPIGATGEEWQVIQKVIDDADKK